MTFQDLSLHSNILKAIEELGYEIPTPIQKKAIPQILEGSDLCASAHTGTGKTAAFLLPTLNKMLTASTKRGRGPRVVILVPTRELAQQVSNESIKYSKYLKKSKTVCIYGGVPYPKQKKDLSRPFEVLVATPGRLIDHLERGRINFSRVEVLILDEADRMLDMGFIDPVTQIADAIPQRHQTLFFSATLKDSVMKLAKHLLNNPKKIKISLDKANIEQRLVSVHNLEHKLHLLDHLLNDTAIDQAIIFTATKIYADQLKEKLIDQGHKAEVLHGDINQSKRTRTINKFKKGQIRLLIATDVAARGIDVQKISHIINFDLPATLEDYVHRIGRTGRIGAKGLAYSFASHKDRKVLLEIEKFSGNKSCSLEVPGMPFKIPERKPRSNKRFNDKSRSRSRNFRDKKSSSKSFRGKSKKFDKKSKSFDDKPRGFRSRSNKFEDKSMNSDDKSKSFDKKSSRFDKKSKFNKFDKQSKSKSFGNNFKSKSFSRQTPRKPGARGR